MTQIRTEQLSPSAKAFDLQSADEIASVLLQGQIAALLTLRDALPAIADGGHMMADTLAQDGRLVYAAAGSSGLMALADACELPGTFGIDEDKVSILVAGGLPRSAHMLATAEEGLSAAEQAEIEIGPKDAAILLSASGTTPYTLDIKRIAKAGGARTICIANNPGTPLLDGADIAICVQTPPEAIGGSTRLGAATAQKAILNMMSTIMGTALGHVHDGMMVNLKADNAKLQQRASSIVATIARISEPSAAQCLESADGNVKAAILLALGASSPTQAASLLEKFSGRLRDAMPAVNDRGLGKSSFM